jgi:glycosyltransferase involved in cell wall biosynthesis
MYRKTINKQQITFKPKKMILNGNVYDVDSIEALSKLRSEIEIKKQQNVEILEEQKNQKVLVKRIRSKNNDDRIVKIINDIGKMQDSNYLREKKRQQEMQAKQKAKLEENKKPKLNVISNLSKKQSVMKLTEQTNELNKVNDTLEENIKQKLISIKKHDNKPLKKLDYVRQEIVNVTNEPNEINGSKSRTLSIKTHEKKQQLNIDQNKQLFDMDDKPISETKTLSVTRKSVNKIKQLIPQNNMDNEIDLDEDNTIPNNLDDDVLCMKNTDNGLYFTKNYEVIKSQWYILVIKTDKNSPPGIVKIIDDMKNKLIPTITINNDMFLYKRFETYAEYRIYFITMKTSKTVDIHSLGLNIKDIKIQQLSIESVTKGIDVWKFRKLYDLEFINYYISKLKLDCTEKFIQRFRADYELYKDPQYFDKFVKGIKIDQKTIKKKNIDENVNNVLYLIYSSIEYEEYNYTIRTHYLIKNSNSINDKYKIFGVTRYGYPYDREPGYYGDQPNDTFELDDVTYYKLLNNKDNFNNNTILEYIRKYIIAVIKLALETNAKIIHACSNYWNGLAAYYAAKYLGIKCVYELRNLWDETITIYRPEIKNSDMVRMMINQEKMILTNVDKIITPNNTLKKILENSGYDSNKISVIDNGIDTTLFTPNGKNMQSDLMNKYNLSDNDIVIGYIGSILLYEGLDMILKCMKKLNNNNIKFLLVGDGFYKNDLLKLTNELNLQKNVIYVGKVNHQDIPNYYDLIDIVIYPRKIYDLCNSTPSYKLLESMAMEKPIIVPNLEAYNEIIIDNENGLYFEANDENSLLEKLTILLENETLRSELGKNARNWVIENRNWNNITNELTNIYESIIEY